MNDSTFDHEAAEIAMQLPPGLRVAVIGSASFWHPETELTCAAVGRQLSELQDLVLLTGGVSGVGEAVGRSFDANQCARDGGDRVYHVLPRGYPVWDYGTTLFAGGDMGQRREVLGRVAQLYICIEGGPGTAQEASVALARQALVVPIGRSGGHAGDLYQIVRRPVFSDDATWGVLGSANSSVLEIAEAVIALVREYATDFDRRAGLP